MLVESDVPYVCLIFFDIVPVIVTLCLLPRDIYRGGSLISGSKIDLVLTKEEWVSVLKLSTIWNMNKVG